MRLTASLVAAAAATALTTLIPLALASSASAATAPPAPETYNSTNWGGYVDIPATGDVVGMTAGTFTVPKINCAKSLIGPHEAPLAWRKAHGNDWSAVAYWVGIDGIEGTPGALEQTGITGVCHSKTSKAVYDAWYQDDASTRHTVTLDEGRPVEAGDVIHVYVADNALLGSAKVRGKSYTMKIVDSTQHGEQWYDGDVTTPATAPDASADYITEAVNDGPNIRHDATGLAATQPVHWSYAAIATFNSGGANDIATLPGYWTAQNWALTRVKANSGARSIYITTGPLGEDSLGYSTFTSTFVWPHG